MECVVCPRRCCVNRPESLQDGKAVGLCGMGRLPVVARAGVHRWEEPCISGTHGSGTVFFSGCSMKCCYCQNHVISTDGFGREISVARLREIYRELAAQGVHNINLVNPTHFIPAVASSLSPAPPIPVVYNSSGYERVSSLAALDGKIQIYLPDYKYSDSSLAARYSNAPDYVEVAARAILEMYRQTGAYRMDRNGVLLRGVVIRHLILPGLPDNTFGVIDWIADHFKPGQILFSLMAQYVPCGRAHEYPEINRTLTEAEYQRVQDYLFCTRIEDGYLQGPDAAREDFIPDFSLQGV